MSGARFANKWAMTASYHAANTRAGIFARISAPGLRVREGVVAGSPLYRRGAQPDPRRRGAAGWWRPRRRVAQHWRRREVPATKPSVAPEHIERWLQGRGAIGDFHRLAEGLESQAFAFRRGQVEFVIRVGNSEAGFEKDRYAGVAFGRAELPVPEVVEIGRLDAGPAYCISRRASGVRLADLGAAEADRLARDVAGTIAAIAASDVTDTTGFGRFDGLGGSAAHATWRAFLLSVADPRAYDWRVAAGRVDMALVSRALAAVADLCRHCPEERRLVHGDFGSYNLVSDGQRITAVVDWNLALYGDPLYEWANVHFWGEERLRPVLACFGPPAEASVRLLCYALRIGLEELHRAGTGDNPVDIGWLTARCAALLDEGGVPA